MRAGVNTYGDQEAIGGLSGTQHWTLMVDGHWIGDTSVPEGAERFQRIADTINRMDDMLNGPSVVLPMPQFTDIHAGDRYRFKGLAGDDELDGREMTVITISVSGMVQFSISFKSEKSRGIFDASYTDVIRMIDDGIWERIT